MEAEKEKKIQLIVFRLGTEEYALEIDKIKEVVATPPISRVPLTPAYIKGVANVRGEVLAIIDPEERFKIGQNSVNADKKYLLVVESKELRMGILVHDVPNTLTVKSTDIDNSPNIIQDENADGNYIKGIIKLPQRLIILVDVYKLALKEEVVSVHNK